MDPETSVAIAVRMLANQFHRYVAGTRGELIARFPELAHTTEVQGRIVEYLFDNLGKQTLYQRDLEKEFKIRRSTATIILQRMEKAGLLVREVSPDDARLKALVLTERARKIHPMVHAAIMRAEERAKSGLTEEEVQAFLRISKKIVKNMS